MARYWFRQKRFGYGATPNTWQGWLFTLIFLALILVMVFGTDFVIADPILPRWVKGIGVIVLAVAFVWVALVKTEPE